MLQRLFCLLCLGIVGTCALAEVPDLPIGVIVPLTGGLAERGQSIARLSEFMAVRLNARQHKYRYRFVIDDGKCGIGNGAVSAANKFIYVDKIKFIITGCSGETLQIAPIAQKNKVLVIATLSNHQDVSRAGEYIFRNFPRNQEMVDLYTKMIKRDAGLPVSVISEENAFTLAYRDLVLEALKGQITSSDDYAYDSEDFRAILTRVKSLKPKSLFLNCASPKTCAALVSQTRALGLKQPIYTNSFAKDPAFLAATGAAANHVKMVDFDEAKGVSAEYDNLIAEYKAKYHTVPPMDLMARAAFDAINMIAEGVDKFGADSDKVKNFFYAYSANGALGQVKYDVNGDMQGLGHVLKEIIDGKVVLIK
jgi:branched-chain amino acid transport system substrate-binding protein